MLHCVSRIAKLEGCGQDCEDGGLRTQVRLRFRGEGTAGTLSCAESRSRASEFRAQISLWLRMEFLSMMAHL